MLDSVVSKYLQSHKRLIVPQLGAFLVKQAGQSVVFSELMKRDDGVLRGLLLEEGLSEVEVAGEIDRFIFEVRHHADRGQVYEFRGVGRFEAGPNATIVFHYDPKVKMDEEEVPFYKFRHKAEERISVEETPKVESQEAQPVEKPTASEATSVSEVAETKEEVTSEPRKMNETEQQQHREAALSRLYGDTPMVKDSVATEQQALKEQEQNTIPSRFDGDKMAQRVATAFKDDVHVSESAKRNPAPFVKGLQYRRPHKSTDACDFVDRPQKKKGVDRFLIFALLAALLAVGAILFGYYVNEERQRLMSEEEPIQSEQFEVSTQADEPLQNDGEKENK